ncbi:hypothetical protein Tco_0585833 [Tanacetum coccineum]
MNSEVVKGSETRIEESSKRAGDELESDMLKKQKIDEHVEVEKYDQEEAEMKRDIEIVKEDKVAIDAIPLATKPPVIVEYQIDKDGMMGYFKLIRANGSSKRYLNCTTTTILLLHLDNCFRGFSGKLRIPSLLIRNSNLSLPSALLMIVSTDTPLLTKVKLTPPFLNCSFDEVESDVNMFGSRMLNVLLHKAIGFCYHNTLEFY